GARNSATTVRGGDSGQRHRAPSARAGPSGTRASSSAASSRAPNSRAPAVEPARQGRPEGTGARAGAGGAAGGGADEEDRAGLLGQDGSLCPLRARAVEERAVGRNRGPRPSDRGRPW